MDSLKCSDNMFAYLDSEKSELLNSYFSSNFTDEDRSYIPSFKLDFDINPLIDIEFTPCIIHNKLTLLRLLVLRDSRYYYLKNVHSS